MFPMSRKQAHNAQMMQKLQPEMKEIQKKYKKDPEAARKAQQELWSKHNYNPLGGCLPLVIQMPIFLGLYRALQVNVELRDAPLYPTPFAGVPTWPTGHAVRLEFLHACNRQQRRRLFLSPHIGRHGRPWPLFEPLPHYHACLVPVQQKVMMPPAADDRPRSNRRS